MDIPSRRSRGKQPQSYRFEDEYAFLDSDDDASINPQQNLGDDGGDFIPNNILNDQGEQDDEFEEDPAEDDITDQDDDSHGSEEELCTSKRPAIRSAAVKNTTSSPKTPSQNRSRKAVTRLISPGQLTPGSAVKTRSQNSDKLRSRGVADFSKIGGQEVRLRDLFGPESGNLKPILTTRDYWSTQEALPLKQEGGLRRSFFEKDGAREKETRDVQAWYRNSGEAAFARGQRCSNLSSEEGQIHLLNDASDTLNVLWGAASDPQLCSMEKVTYRSISEPWEERKDRRGWLFYLGSRIQDAQWATKEDSSTQYLAVAVEQKPQVPQTRPLEQLRAPAFSATTPFPASVQVWEFQATPKGELENEKDPRLRLVICTNWGAPKQLRWCPIDATESGEIAAVYDTKRLGLLAGIWSDGHVRILDIIVPDHELNNDEPHFLFYSQAAFDIQLPQTIPTCLHWISGLSLAVATAVGTVGIWTLSRSETFPSSETDQYVPRPWFYQPLADTYILTISSGWPSQPQFLSISVADGFSRLFDIRSPATDNVASIRGRTLCVSQSWHEHTQSFVMPDEHYILKHNPIRRYYHNLYSMRLDSSITRVATSPVHPGILIGGTEGNVEASNPVGRIANYKVIPWQQKWFVHEWRRPVKDVASRSASEGEDIEVQDRQVQGNANASSSTGDEVTHSVLAQPLVRITEGYKATQPGIQHSVTSKKPMNPETGKGITIHEESSAITVLAWNPNLKFGSWAVAGMGSGLLRVEDVAV